MAHSGGGTIDIYFWAVLAKDHLSIFRFKENVFFFFFSLRLLHSTAVHTKLHLDTGLVIEIMFFFVTLNLNRKKKSLLYDE